MRRFTGFDVGQKAISKLTTIAIFAMLINIFFVLMEIFTVFYSAMPEHSHHFQYLFAGIDGKGALVPWMWFSQIAGLISVLVLMLPSTRKKGGLLVLCCLGLVVSIWIDKGLGMVTGGFVPNPLGHVTEYIPTFPEIMITLAIWALGFFILTVFYKIVLTMRGQVAK